jgi:hypothetical protein
VACIPLPSRQKLATPVAQSVHKWMVGGETEQFLPGRTCLQYDMRPYAHVEVPTAYQASKEDCPNVEDRVSFWYESQRLLFCV